jgi:hypothetical protein
MKTIVTHVHLKPGFGDYDAGDLERRVCRVKLDLTPAGRAGDPRDLGGPGRGGPSRAGRGWRWGLAILLLALPLSRPGWAAEFACAGGDVPCLLAAIQAANANGEGNTIALAAGTYTLTAIDNTIVEGAMGANGLPAITSPLTIRGAGARTTIIERAASAPDVFRLLYVAPAGILTLDGLTLRGGFAGGFNGGAILNDGTVTITDSLLAGNTAAFGPLTSAGGIGGAIENAGTLTITNSTLAGNVADGRGTAAGGGAVWNRGFAGTTLTITNSTLAGNSVKAGQEGTSPFGSGGGIFSERGAIVSLQTPSWP